MNEEDMYWIIIVVFICLTFCFLIYYSTTDILFLIIILSISYIYYQEEELNLEFVDLINKNSNMMVLSLAIMFFSFLIIMSHQEEITKPQAYMIVPLSDEDIKLIKSKRSLDQNDWDLW